MWIFGPRYKQSSFIGQTIGLPRKKRNFQSTMTVILNEQFALLSRIVRLPIEAIILRALVESRRPKPTIKWTSLIKYE